MAETTTTTEAVIRNSRKHRKGVVISKSGNKSIVVQSERRRVHPEYGKVVRQFKKYHVHDESNEAKVGDQVEITECRPLSRLKHWRLVAVTQVAKGAQKA
ncbi:MAG: 30S ribosomal protein S17 [bacterium]